LSGFAQFFILCFRSATPNNSALGQQAVVDLIMTDPAVDTVRSNLGGSGLMNAGNLQIILKPQSDRSVTADLVIARIRKQMSAMTGVSCGFRLIPAGYSDVKPATVPI